MKHLKLFESVSESDFDDVKDIFQDIVDEYDIYKISMHSGAQTLSSGLYYAYKFITGNASYNKSNSLLYAGVLLLNKGVLEKGCLYLREAYVLGNEDAKRYISKFCKSTSN